jgi:hypothetical protein
MSVSLLIKHTKYFDEHMPVASAGAYREYWKKPAIELGLPLLPLLDEYIGNTTIKQEVQQILEEIKTLYEFARQSDDADYQKHAESRMPRIIKALQEAVDEWEEVEYINMG